MFIDNIKFNENENENFHPFNKNCEIKFLGEEEIQKLISFYKDDKIAKKFKINCILANNGGGKSRFFEAFVNQDDENKLNLISKKSKGDKKPILEINEGNKSFNPNVIWDSFSTINKEKRSVNNNLLSGNGLNQFYLDLYNFLSEKKDTYEKEDINKIFSEFTNSDLLNENGYKIIISSILEKYEFVIDEIINELWQKYGTEKSNTLNGKNFRNFLNIIYSYNGFGGTFYDYNIGDYRNIKDLLENNDNFFYHYLFISGIIKDYLETLRNKSNDKKEHSDFITDFSHYHKELLNEKRKQEMNEILKLPFNEMIDNLYNLFTKKTFFEKEFFNDKTHFSKEEIIFFSKYYKIDFQFKIKNENKYKSFEKLSSGEQVIIARFSNIYMFLKPQRTNVILIDEPDLHLHLDWQRKYIKTLIDVFSKLNTELDVFNNTYFHFILATHSPFIVSDLPSESIVLFDKNESENFTQIKNFDREKQEPKEKLKNKSFGANYVDLIRDGFFFENQVLMGSFAEKIIGDIAKNELEAVMNGSENFEGKELKNQIGDEFLRDNLLYFKT